MSFTGCLQPLKHQTFILLIHSFSCKKKRAAQQRPLSTQINTSPNHHAGQDKAAGFQASW